MGLLESGMLVCLGRCAGFGFRVAAAAGDVFGEPILDEEEGELELEPDLKLNLVASRSLSFRRKTSAPAVPFFLRALVDFIMIAKCRVVVQEAAYVFDQGLMSVSEFNSVGSTCMVDTMPHYSRYMTLHRSI